MSPCEPSTQSSAITWLAPGSTAVAKIVLLNDQRVARANAADRLTPGAFAAASAAEIGIGSKLFCAVIEVVAGEDVVHRARERLHDAGRERRDERDEREPDHECGRGRGGALRVAAAFSRASWPAAPPNRARRPAEDPREWPDERDESSATPRNTSSVPRPMPEQDLRRAEAGAKIPYQQPATPSNGERGADGMEAGEAARGEGRAFAHGRDRRNTRRADAGSSSRRP